MKIKTYKIQESRNVDLGIFNVDRINYEILFDSLKFPLVWSYDTLCRAWIPAEVDLSFVKYLKSLPGEIDQSSESPIRIQQLRRAGLLEVGRKNLEQLKEEMSTQGFVKISQLLDSEYCRFQLINHYFRNDHLHVRHPDMEGIKRVSVNNMPLMQLLHQSTEWLVNQLIPEQVKTSYSFAACYESGSNLPAHTDRSQCVYNISLLFGSDPFRARLSDWPIFIKHGDKVNRVDLELGDSVLYSGTEDLHWREIMPSNVTYVAGVFFHYVPINFNGSLD